MQNCTGMLSYGNASFTVGGFSSRLQSQLMGLLAQACLIFIA